MKSKRLYYIIIFIVFCIPVALAGTAWTAEEATMVNKCEEALSYRRFELLIDVSRILSESSRINRNQESSDMALAFSLYGAVMLETDSMVDQMGIEASKRIADPDKASKRAAAWLNMALAEYSITEIDYSKAARYAFDAIEAANELRHKDLVIMALGQLARIYNNKEDDSGIKWARECMRLAEKSDSPSSRYLAAINMSSYILKQGDLRQASSLFAQADSIAHQTGMRGEYSFLDTFRAEILVRLKQYDKAEHFFKKALLYSESTVPRDRWYACVSYGSFLNSRQRYREALGLFEEAEKISIGHKPYAQEYYAYLAKSEALEALGSFSDALQAYKEYNRLLTEAISAEREREIASLEVRNKIAEQRSVNSRQAMELMRRKQDLTITLSICVLLFVSLVAFSILYIRRVRYSRQMTDLNIKAASNERQLRLQLAETLQQQGQLSSQDTEQVPDKLDRLYLQLIQIMEEQHIYRDSSLTLEKLSSILSTNRTYLSKAIRLKTGMSYSAFINELRLNEAIRILSSSSSPEVVKSVANAVGFYNQSTFYRLFKQKTNLSPAQFRQQSYNLEQHDQYEEISEEEG